MSVRGVAIVVFVLSLAILFAYLQLVGKGLFASAAARHLREMKERVASPDSIHDTTHAAMAALPNGLPPTRTAPIEARGARIEGYVQRMFYSTDGDLHLEVTPAIRRPGDRDTVYITAEITLLLRQRHSGWRYGVLDNWFRPNLETPRRDAPTRRVRLTGWLLYDYQYDGLERSVDPFRSVWNRFGLSRPYRPTGPTSIWPRLTGWEIHPVTKIEVWDETRDRYAEVGP